MRLVNELKESLNKSFGWNKARMDYFSKMLLGLLSVGTVNLKKIAIAFDDSSQIESRYRRIKRFLGEFEWVIEDIARWMYGQFFRADQKVYVILDRTNWFFGKAKINVLTLAIAYEGVAIPILWTLLPKAGNATGHEHAEMIYRFTSLFGKEVIEGVLADREFANQVFFRYLMRENIPFYIRVKEGAQVNFFGEKNWAVKKLFKRLPLRGIHAYVQPVIIHGQKLFVTAGRSERGELLIVATNRKENNQDRSAVPKYLRRWEIENLFQSLKGRGFCLEDTHLTRPERLEKLMALLAIGFAWAHKVGEWKAKKKPIGWNQYRESRRPQYTFFRYGWDILREIILHLYHRRKAFLSCVKRLALPPNPFALPNSGGVL